MAAAWKGVNKGTVASASTSVWEEAAPPALAPKPNSSVPPHVSLAPFELLSQCWSSERMNLSVVSPGGPFKRTPGTPATLRLTQPPSPLVSTARVVGASLPGTGIPGWGARYEAGTPRSYEGTSIAEISLPTTIQVYLFLSLIHI